jgi:tRNA dimethylallyltransferase
VLAGGTGLYLRAALAELKLPPAPPPGRRAHWERVYDRAGPDATHRLLTERDPDGAAHVHANDRRRVVRALELAELGTSLRPESEQLWTEDARRPTIVFGLDVPRHVLDERIERRAQAMFDAGVVEEAKRALKGPISATAAQALGLREIAELPTQAARDADRPPHEVADEIVEVARARQHLPAGRAG